MLLLFVNSIIIKCRKPLILQFKRKLAEVIYLYIFILIYINLYLY